MENRLLAMLRLLSDSDDVRAYFRHKTNPKRDYTPIDPDKPLMEEVFTSYRWRYLIGLNDHVNGELHQVFEPTDGKTTMVVEPNYRGGDFWKNNLKNLDGVKVVDIKDATSE
jgi:hypothetical protein